jgi:hypothetical protein
MGSLPYGVATGRLAMPARRIGQRWRATRAPQPVVYGGEGPASGRASHSPRRYPQSDKRLLVESTKAISAIQAPVHGKRFRLAK